RGLPLGPHRGLPGECGRAGGQGHGGRVLPRAALHRRRRRTPHLAGPRLGVPHGAPALGEGAVHVPLDVHGLREAARPVEPELLPLLPHRGLQGMAVARPRDHEDHRAADPHHPAHDGHDHRISAAQPRGPHPGRHPRPRGVADPDPWHPRYLPPAQAPAGDPPAAGGRAGGHPHRAADQGLRLRDHEQAGLADAQRGGIRRGRPDLRDPRGTRPVGRAGALRPRGARPGARARRAGDRAAAGGGRMTPQQARLPALARRLGAAALALALPLAALPAPGDGPGGPPALPPGESEYPGDPPQEAAQARAEDLRIADARSMVDSSRWAFAPGAPPLTLPTGGTSTVVLLAREEPYTLEELAEVVPEAVEREEDGDLLISSHLVIDRGATLRIRTEGEHAVHLESTPESFASLVSIGGTLDVAGAEGKPLRITGWDSSRDRADE